MKNLERYSRRRSETAAGLAGLLRMRCFLGALEPPSDRLLRPGPERNQDFPRMRESHVVATRKATRS